LGAAAFAVLHQGQSVRVEEMIGKVAYLRIRPRNYHSLNCLIIGFVAIS
jgi:hypothetical protein